MLCVQRKNKEQLNGVIKALKNLIVGHTRPTINKGFCSAKDFDLLEAKVSDKEEKLGPILEFLRDNDIIDTTGKPAGSDGYSATNRRDAPTVPHPNSSTTHTLLPLSHHTRHAWRLPGRPNYQYTRVFTSSLHTCMPKGEQVPARERVGAERGT